MAKKWFQHSEVMAGTGRLLLSYYVYKIFGSWILRLIAFFVASIAFITSNDRRGFSIQFFRVLNEYTNKNYPLLLSSYRQFLNYGNSLVDKVISFSKNMASSKFKFTDSAEEKILQYIKNKKGIFFLTTHIGNIEIMRSILQSQNLDKPLGVNVFLEKRSCSIFNEFLNSIKANSEFITPYAVEDIDMNTAIELSEKLNSGQIIFMAGDRTSVSNPNRVYKTNFLNKTISLPLGALKFAQMLNVPIFFIICVPHKKNYNIYAQEFIAKSPNKKEALSQLKEEYSAFLEKFAIKYPYQFFNFYKIFE